MSKEDKLYYTIGEVAEILNVNTSLLRHWESELKDLKPKRNTTGKRSYTKDDIEYLKNIYFLTKEKGLSLSKASEYIKVNNLSANKISKSVEGLKRIKEFLIQLNQQLDD